MVRGKTTMSNNTNKKSNKVMAKRKIDNGLVSGFNKLNNATKGNEVISEVLNNSGELRNIKLDNLHEYTKHHYKKISVEKFDGLKEDIKRQGQLVPLIVLERGKDDFMILAGHNRWRALIENRKEVLELNKTLEDDKKEKVIDYAKCIVKKGLDESSCEMIVQADNLARRSFEDMSLQEKCENIHSYYEIVKKWYFEHKPELVGKFETREEVGNRLAMNYKSVERYNLIYKTFLGNESWYDYCPDNFDFSVAFTLCGVANKEFLTELFKLFDDYKSKEKLFKVSVAQAKSFVDGSKNTTLSPHDYVWSCFGKKDKNNKGEKDVLYSIPKKTLSPRISSCYSTMGKEDLDVFNNNLDNFLGYYGFCYKNPEFLKDFNSLLNKYTSYLSNQENSSNESSNDDSDNE